MHVLKLYFANFEYLEMKEYESLLLLFLYIMYSLMFWWPPSKFSFPEVTPPPFHITIFSGGPPQKPPAHPS